MPCDREYTISVNLEVADKALLIKALEALGYVPRVDVGIRFRLTTGAMATIAKGVIEVPRGYEDIIPKIRQSYAAQCVAAAATRFGWVQKTTSPQQLTLTRRR